MHDQNSPASVSRPRLQDLSIAVISGGLGLWFLTATIHLYRDRTAFLHYSLVKYAMAAVLLAFAYKTFRDAPKRLAHYVKREHGAAVEIEVSPAAPPAAWLPAALPVVMVSGMVLEPGTPGLWIMGLLFTGITALILLRDPRGRGSATRRSIRVGRDGIDIGGQMLRQADIHHLRIKNKFAGDVEITYDANRGVPTGTVIGLAHRRQVAKVAYRVEAESSGKAHILAAGLDEITARGVLAEVGKALGQKSAA
jgi:hypothetical protein